MALRISQITTVTPRSCLVLHKDQEPNTAYITNELHVQRYRSSPQQAHIQLFVWLSAASILMNFN